MSSASAKPSTISALPLLDALVDPVGRQVIAHSARSDDRQDHLLRGHVALHLHDQGVDYPKDQQADAKGKLGKVEGAHRIARAVTGAQHPEPRRRHVFLVLRLQKGREFFQLVGLVAQAQRLARLLAVPLRGALGLELGKRLGAFAQQDRQGHGDQHQTQHQNRHQRPQRANLLDQHRVDGVENFHDCIKP